MIFGVEGFDAPRSRGGGGKGHTGIANPSGAYHPFVAMRVERRLAAGPVPR